MIYDYTVIGGGIVGLSTAWQLQRRHPNKKVLLIEKEKDLAAHQTGHNSGVIHAGVYYQPGSLKAKLCKAGAEATKRFCEKNGIPFEECGKLIVATNEHEVQRLDALHTRCRTNEIDVSLLNRNQLKSLEPAIEGLAAMNVSATAIVDYRLVAQQMAVDFEKCGGSLRLSCEVTALKEKPECITIETSPADASIATSRFVISCAGLMADRIAKMMDIATGFRIIPYRGEYFRLDDRLSGSIDHLIYPVPDPALPFLGIHLTKVIDGSITVGPNAVQGWKREGYGRVNIDVKDIWEMVCFPGFWKVSAKHFSTGIKEMWNSLNKRGYLKQVQKYCPTIKLEDLMPYPAGIRAQAVLDDGSLVHDFLFKESKRSLHVCNAPSPAATSAIPIGEYICDKIAERQQS